MEEKIFTGYIALQFTDEDGETYILYEDEDIPAKTLEKSFEKLYQLYH